MQLEFRHGDTVVRVDGDVVEIFGQDFSHRYLLPSLRVEVQPGPGKGTLVVRPHLRTHRPQPLTPSWLHGHMTGMHPDEATMPK